MRREAAAASVSEEHFFFQPGSTGQSVYARTHIPSDASDLGMVVVAPIGRERLRVYQEMRILGRDVAQAGFPVLRFDYRGEGESAGEFRDSTVTSRVADTVAAANELRRRCGVQRLALVGFHLGAAVAALAANEAGADCLVLCDPVWTAQPYVKDLLRANVFQQSQYFGRPTAQEDDLRASLKSGNAISFFGFPTAAPLIDELETLNVDMTLRAFNGASAILGMSAKELAAVSAREGAAALLGAPSRCTVTTVDMGFSWTTRKRWAPRLGALNDAIVEWLRSQDTTNAGSAGREARGPQAGERGWAQVSSRRP